jgi:hypothetical protein
MTTPKTQFDLHLAAQATAIKNLDATSALQAAQNVLDDFNELKLDDSFFADFRDDVEHQGDVLGGLRQRPLVVPTPEQTKTLTTPQTINTTNT